MGPFHLLRIVVPLCAAATFLLSHPLWTSARGYPLVPAIEGLPQPPAIVSTVLFGLVLLALAATAAGKLVRPALATALAIFAVWALLDQNRWQPYLVFFSVALVSILLQAGAKANARTAFAPLQLLMCCTYIYSGLHKFNYRHVTREFGSFVAPLGIALPEPAMMAGALFAAAFELSMGVLLLFARTRRPAVIGLTLMHAFILLALGPLGANYNTVVWPWNIASIAALWVVFARDERDSRRWLTDAPRATRRIAYAVLLLFGLMPLLSFAGLWIRSLSFQLYSGKQPAATIGVSRRAGLPPVAARVTDSNNQLDVFAWGMQEMNVSASMERDVVVDVARQLCRKSGDRNMKLAWADAPALLSRGRQVHHYTFSGPECRPQFVTKLHEPGY